MFQWVYHYNQKSSSIEFVGKQQKCRALKLKRPENIQTFLKVSSTTYSQKSRYSFRQKNMFFVYFLLKCMWLKRTAIRDPMINMKITFRWVSELALNIYARPLNQRHNYEHSDQ